MYGWDYPLLAFVYPDFDSGSVERGNQCMGQIGTHVCAPVNMSCMQEARIQVLHGRFVMTPAAQVLTHG